MVDDYVTTKNAAELLGVTHGRIRQMIADGSLPAVKIGEGRAGIWLIKRHDVEIARNRPKPGRPKDQEQL